MNLRIGHGYDAHQLQAGYPLILGGVTIPHPKGLVGHSDADVLLHAIADALLGAAALGDLGQHFPSTDTALKAIDSRILLRRVVAMLQEQRFQIVNIDATIIAQQPKLAPFIAEMRGNIAADTAIDLSCVSVKATTTDHLGFTGREEGIAAIGMVLVRR